MLVLVEVVAAVSSMTTSNRCRNFKSWLDKISQGVTISNTQMAFLFYYITNVERVPISTSYKGVRKNWCMGGRWIHADLDIFTSNL